MAVSDLINLSALLDDAKCFAMSSPNVCPASPPLGAQDGAAGVRLGRKLGLTTSRNTLLHLVRQRVPVAVQRSTVDRPPVVVDMSALDVEGVVVAALVSRLIALAAYGGS